MFRDLVKTVHFIGIGGIGMSAIAEVLVHQGIKITGSDLQENMVIDHLRKLGATIYLGHKAENVAGADAVVVTSAVHQDNCELCWAREHNIPVVHRSEMLADLMRSKYGICVAGTHGKTTITSLISTLLVAGGLDPTAIVGGVVHGLGSNAVAGKGEYLVAEADESDGSFLGLHPTIAVISNIEAEHLDHYTGGIEEIRRAFAAFADKVPFYGRIVACLDNPEVAALLPKFKRPCITYGFTKEAEWRADNIRLENGLMHFDLWHHGQKQDEIALHLWGRHNVLNSLAAIAVAAELAVPLAVIKDVLAGFQGVGRRLEIKGEAGGITVIDDYGHHPTEIQTTISALKAACGGHRLVVAFQPHRYSRTRDLLSQFATAFGAADELFLTDIYAASEEPLPGINGQLLAKVVAANRERVHYAADNGALTADLLQELKSGDILLTLGAGNLFKVGETILETIRKK